MTADDHLSPTQFGKHPYKAHTYRAEITFKSGRTGNADILKTQEGNPSARGGAYRDVWVAKHATYQGTGETRQQAYDALLNHEKLRGIVQR